MVDLIVFRLMKANHHFTKYNMLGLLITLATHYIDLIIHLTQYKVLDINLIGHQFINLSQLYLYSINFTVCSFNLIVIGFIIQGLRFQNF